MLNSPRSGGWGSNGPDWNARLTERIEEVARHLFGKPNRALSDQRTLRYGNKGSLKIELTGDKRGVWFDHGAGEGGNAYQLVVRELGKAAAHDWICGFLGDDRCAEGAPRKQRTKTAEQQAAERESDDARKIESAAAIWRSRVPATEDTATARYLRSRGYNGPIPENIQHCGSLPYWTPGTSAGSEMVKVGDFPALVAIIHQADGRASGVQRIYLSQDGRKAKLDPAKKAAGVLEGGAVRLSQPGPVAAVGEGIETMLAVLEARPDLYALSAISAGGIKTLGLPAGIREVILCADADEAGENAVQEAAARFHAVGIRVRVVCPPAQRKGYDLADLLADDGVDAVRVLIDSASEWAPAAKSNDAPVSEPPPARRPRLIEGIEPTFNSLPMSAEQASRELDAAISGWLDDVDHYWRTREAAHTAADVTDVELLAEAGVESLDDILDDDERARWKKERSKRRRNVSARVRRRAGIKSSQPPRLSIQGAAGLGKTSRLIKQLAGRPYLLNLGVDIYSTRIDMARDIRVMLSEVLFRPEGVDGPMNFAGPPVIDMRGRSQPDAVTGKPLCRRSKLAEKTAAVGKAVYSTLCRRKDPATGKFADCPHYKDCPYLDQYRGYDDQTRGKTFIRCWPHQHLTLPRTLNIERGRIVIVDESPIDALVESQPFGLDRLLAPRQCENPADEADVLATAQRVHGAMLADGPLLSNLRTAGVTADELNNAARIERQISDGVRAGVRPDMSDSEIDRRLDALEASEADKRASMFGQLAVEIELPRDVAHGVELRRNTPMPNGERQDRIYLHYLRELLVGDDVPALMLDADADLDINRRIWGQYAEHVSIPVERRATVTQVYSSRFSNSRLLGKREGANDQGAGRRLRSEIAMVASRMAAASGPGLVVSNKEVRTAMAGEVRSKETPLAAEWQGVTITHFGAIRGRDGFKDLTWAMIVGREQPPPAAVEAVARGLWSDSPDPLQLPGDYVEAPRGYRMRDGRRLGVMAQVHPDPRVQKVLELKREREIGQAIDRLRLVHRKEPAEVLILCSLPVDVTVDRLVSWTEVVEGGNRLQRAWSRREILPTGARDLAACFPDLFPTEKAAKRYLQNHDLNGPTFQIECNLESGPNYRTAEYRRESVAGPSCKVLYNSALYPSPEEAKAALESMLGCGLSVFRPINGGAPGHELS